MDVFSVLLLLGGGLIVLSLLWFLIIILRAGSEFSRAVLADVVFYAMVGCYLVWSMTNPTQIDYEIVMLAALVGGAFPTMSMGRIISKGRR